MPYFTKKPVTIEAIQWTGENIEEVCRFCPDCYWDGEIPVAIDSGVLVVKTLEGHHVASFGDWIIRGVKGEFYPCKPGIFEQTYLANQPTDHVAEWEKDISTVMEAIQRAEMSALDNPQVEEYLVVAWRILFRLANRQGGMK